MNTQCACGDAVTAEPVLLRVKQVADLLELSERTVFRLADSGKLPRPRRLNSSVRWDRAELLEWCRQGCPRCDGE